MAAFMDHEQRELASAIAARLVERGETVAVGESTTGGLLSAALLSVAGASRYYAGGGVLYTLASRVTLAGVPAERYEDYRGTTPEMVAELAEAMRTRLDATWGLGESGLAGPTGSRFGAPAGRTTIAVVGPVARVETFETGVDDREANMAAFTTFGLHLLRDALDATP